MEYLDKVVIYDEDRGGIWIDIIKKSPGKYKLVVETLEPGDCNPNDSVWKNN